MKDVEFYRRYEDIKDNIFKLQKEWEEISIMERMKRVEKNNLEMNELNNERVRDEMLGNRVNILI